VGNCAEETLRRDPLRGDVVTPLRSVKHYAIVKQGVDRDKNVDRLIAAGVRDFSRVTASALGEIDMKSFAQRAAREQPARLNLVRCLARGGVAELKRGRLTTDGAAKGCLVVDVVGRGVALRRLDHLRSGLRGVTTDGKPVRGEGQDA